MDAVEAEQLNLREELVEATGRFAFSCFALDEAKFIGSAFQLGGFGLLDRGFSRTECGTPSRMQVA